MSSAPEGEIRWGILSTARIGAKVWKAIRFSGNGVVAAAASRDLAAARAFVENNQAEAPFAQAPRALGSYEALLAAPDVDAVYLPVPTALRAPWAEAAAAAGKHVVCEKPCAASPEELHRMLSACERAGVRFMDGVFFMHGARLARMRQALDDGRSVGALRRVSSAFSFAGNRAFFTRDIRTDARFEPQGCLGDLGWYCLRFSLWAGNWAMPRAVRGKILRSVHRPGSPSPVPTAFSGELFFEGWTAAFFCSFDSEFHQWARIDGQLGGLEVGDFVLPRAGGKAGFRAGNEEITVEEREDPDPLGAATGLYRTFAEGVRRGGWDPFWPNVSWKTQLVMEACWRSAREGREIAAPFPGGELRAGA